MILLTRNFWALAVLAIPAMGANWTTFQDPNERAFTVEVPAGWTVQGGMFRLGYSDYRVMIDMKSPDGRVNVRVGDVSIPSYAVPSAQHPREGERIDLGAQAQLTVAKYRTGREYAEAYGHMRFKDCRGLKEETATGAPPAPDTPELAEVKQSTIGEAAYSCDGRSAYVYAKTAFYGGFWQVHQLWSYLAPADQVMSARAVIGEIVKTFKFSDAWVAQQKQYDQEAMVYQRERQRARMRQLSQQVAQFEMRMASMRHQAESFDRALRGVTATVDPLGNPHEVETGQFDGYWTDGLGHYVNSNTMPGPGWQRLKPVE